MTPKETAKELVQKYLYKCIEYAYAKSKYKYLAKQCALICVDEKIETLQHICYLKKGMSKEELEHLAELLEVKQEINNL